MSQYQPYTIPSVAGILFASGANTPQPLQNGDARLCSQADAEVMMAAFAAAGSPGTLVNAATDPTLGFVYEGLDPTSPYQPWYIKGIAFPGLLGYAVAIMWGANTVNGGGIGNPGSWTGLGTGNVRYLPQAPAPAPPPPAAGSNNDAASWAATQGAGQGFNATDELTLNDIRRLVVALAKLQGIS